MIRDVRGDDRVAVPSARYLADSEVLARRFRSLADRWKRETLDTSSLSDLVSHPAYLQVIAMGDAAIPLIIDELEQDPNHWFVALSAITGDVNVIPDDAAGDLDSMVDAWLDWARSTGWL